jgi:hypothetical protein
VVVGIGSAHEESRMRRSLVRLGLVLITAFGAGLAVGATGWPDDAEVLALEL